MIVGVELKKASKMHPVIQHVWDTFFQQWPSTPRCRGDGYAVQQAGDLYHTNFINSCVCRNPFELRQRKHVERWVRATFGAAPPHGTVWSVLCAINLWPSNTPAPAGAAAFVAAERAALGIAAGVVNSEDWRKNHIENVVRYYFHIMNAMPPPPPAGAQPAEDDEDEHAPRTPRRFTLAPLHDIRRHHIMVNITVLRSLARNALVHAPPPGGNVGAADMHIRNLADEEVWDYVFHDKIGGLRGPAWERGAYIKTDGVAVSILYTTPKPPAAPAGGAGAAPGDDDDDDGQPLQGAGPHGAGGAPPPPPPPPAAAPAGAPPARKKRKSKFAATALNNHAAITGNTVVIAIDPGRKSIFYAVVRRPDGSLARKRLSRKAYYHGMGKDKADKRRARECIECRDVGGGGWGPHADEGWGPRWPTTTAPWLARTTR